MALKFVNKKEVSAYLASMAHRIEAALVFRLEALVAELQNHAKLNAGYTDRTSNLKSSIGGVVVKDGKIITYRGFVKEAGATVGDQTGLELINSLAAQNRRGYTIIVVAGMNYASYVENFHNLNVLKKTELLLPKEIGKVLKDLKTAINKVQA